MLVFIDESGDPGFSAGSSPVFVCAMVIFASAKDAAATQEAIAASKARRMHKPEFKFSKCSDTVRDAYFEAVCGCPFMVRAIVVRKDVIHSNILRSEKESFYEFFVKQMMRNDHGDLDKAAIVIDGSGDRLFRQNLEAALRRRLRLGALKSLRFKDSQSDPLIQLADMCAGAIARSYRTDRADAYRWRDALRMRLRDVWDFR